MAADSATWLETLDYPGAAALRKRLQGLILPGLTLLIPERAIDDILRAILFPEMADLSGHTIADHAAITERLLGQPFAEVHAYIDHASSSLGPHHRVVLHDLVTSPGEVAHHFAHTAGGGRREEMAALAGHYLPDSTTPDGIRLLGLPVHLADLIGVTMLASLA